MDMLCHSPVDLTRGPRHAHDPPPPDKDTEALQKFLSCRVVNVESWAENERHEATGTLRRTNSVTLGSIGVRNANNVPVTVTASTITKHSHRSPIHMGELHHHYRSHVHPNLNFRRHHNLHYQAQMSKQKPRAKRFNTAKDPGRQVHAPGHAQPQLEHGQEFWAHQFCVHSKRMSVSVCTSLVLLNSSVLLVCTRLGK